jgi:tRNA-specific 2-thiouridylase
MPKVVVGMSGGVDSSVTAYILKQLGYEVEGLSFILWEARNRSDFTTCCSLEATNDASKTAKSIGIKHSALDVREEFIEKVIEPFIDAYTKGMTPNPCILCNKFIKFPFLLREADKRGAQYIATGHYARVEKNIHLDEKKLNVNDGKIFLKKAVDSKKDQSYVLYALKQEEIKRLILPLGSYTKVAVREIAHSLKLDAANRPESQEICFIEDRNYFKFIEKLSPVAAEPGPIIDKNGKVLGTHKGIYCYTIGQRKGLGISSPEPYYVIKIDTMKNAISVGSKQDAVIKKFFVDNLNWLNPPVPPLLKGGRERPHFRATVKVRSMMEDKPAFIEIIDGDVRVTFEEPQWAPAPGQSAVFYDGESVVGGGVIVM